MNHRLAAILLLPLVLAGVQHSECSPVVILPLGDSITQAEHRNGDQYASYRAPLQISLNNAGISHQFVGSMTEPCGDAYPANFPPGFSAAQPFDPDHEGHWGWTTEEILMGGASHCDGDAGSGKLADWIVGLSLDIVLLHLGTNDILQGETPETIQTNLESIIDVLQGQLKPDGKILLAALIPGSQIDPEVQAVNVKIAEIATADSTVILVDQYTGFDPAVDTYDQLHPDESGEQHMADRWFQAIQATTVPEPSSGMLLALICLAVGGRRYFRFD